MGSRARERWLLAAIVCVALALRLVAVGEYERSHPLADRPVIDERSYEDWALDIAGGNWLGDEVFFQEPLYPYALGALYAAGGDRTLARCLQAALGALTTLAVFALARAVFDQRVAWLAAVAWALYRPALWFPALLLKPNLFVPLFCLLAIALVASRRDGWWGKRRRVWFGVGFLVGLGTLLRGNMLVLAPLFVAWPLLRALLERSSVRAALIPCALVLVGAGAVVLPVCLRNQLVSGRFVMTTSGAGTNFYGGNNPGNPYGVATEFDWVRGVPEHEADDWRHEAERRLGRELDLSQSSSYWLGRSLASMRADPWLHLRIFWRKLRLTLGAYEVADNHFLAWDARHVALLRWPLPGFAVWGTLGLAGLLLACFTSHARRVGRVELGLLFSAYLATIVLTVTSARVRFALVPLLLPFAAHAVSCWVRALRDPRRMLWTCVATLAAAAFVLVPVLPAQLRQRDFDERDYNLAAVWVGAGEHVDRAETIARDLDRRHPGSARLQTMLAEIENRRGRELLDRAAPTPAERRRGQELIAGALARLRDANPGARAQERFRIHLLAGSIQQYLGRWESAERHYRAALEFDREDRDLLRRLAVVLANGAMQNEPGPERSAALRQAEGILVEILADEPNAELDRLLGLIRANL